LLFSLAIQAQTNHPKIAFMGILTRVDHDDYSLNKSSSGDVLKVICTNISQSNINNEKNQSRRLGGKLKNPKFPCIILILKIVTKLVMIVNPYFMTCFAKVSKQVEN
jgi:hypothetical protein